MSGARVLIAGLKAASKLGGQQSSRRWSFLSLAPLLSTPWTPANSHRRKWGTAGLKARQKSQRVTDTSKPCPWAPFKALFLDRNQAEQRSSWSLGAVQGSDQPCSLSSPSPPLISLYFLLPCAKRSISHPAPALPQSNRYQMHHVEF